MTTLRKARKAAQEIYDRGHRFEHHIRAGNAPPHALITADRLAVVARLREIEHTHPAFSGSSDLRLVADMVEEEIGNADR